MTVEIAATLGAQLGFEIMDAILHLEEIVSLGSVDPACGQSVGDSLIEHIAGNGHRRSTGRY